MSLDFRFVVPISAKEPASPTPPPPQRFTFNESVVLLGICCVHEHAVQVWKCYKQDSCGINQGNILRPI